MKKRKFIGITLIAASVLLQVGYATTAGQNLSTVNIGEFKVNFQSAKVTNQDKYMNVKVTPDSSKGTVSVDVANLYPGARFGVETVVNNSGELDATITKIEILQRSKEYSELYNNLIGYVGDAQIENYNAYLKETYLGQVVKADEALTIGLEMGLSPNVTTLQNEQVQFDIRIEFGQEEPSTGGGGGGGTGGGGGGDNNGGGTLPDIDIETPDTELPEESIPGGGIELPEESIPGEDIELAEEGIPGGGIELPEESIPGGARSKSDRDTPEGLIELLEESIPGGQMLPQTGGVTPTLVYGIGIALLGSGIAIYRKKDEKGR